MAKSQIKLNKNQQKAVEHSQGPLLVVAGAGTGKTRVITERIKNLITSQNTTPTEILAVTFTEKASKEMLERLDDVMPLGYEEPWIYTFHSFADRILKSEGLEIGLDSGYRIISYPEQWLLLRQNLFKLDLKYFRPLGNPTKFISAILKFISRLQDENISPAELEEFAQNYTNTQVTEEKERWLELAHIYKRYNELKIENSKMDFGDLINWTIELFKQRPNILKKYQDQFKHVLVDEFQDTNYAQYELIKMIYPAEDNESANKQNQRSLLVVGDDSQSIYKFRGAAVSNILEFRKDYPNCEMITLLENYRSHQEILDPAYKLIQNNNPDTLESKLGISKELVSKVVSAQEKGAPNSKKRHTAPQVILLNTAEDEVELTILKILEILGTEPTYTYKDFAILARANNHLDPFIFALRKYRLPYQLVGNRGLYDRDEIRNVMALLRFIIDPTDSISLYRILNLECLSIDPALVSKILTESRYKKTDMYETTKLLNSEKLNSLNEKVLRFQAIISNKGPVEFIHAVVNEVGFMNGFIKEETLENQMCVRNLNLFLDKAKSFEVTFRQDTKEIPNIVDFMEYLELMLEAGDNPAQAEIEDIETINLLTVHASKGLEFNVVFMVNLVSDRFPTRDRSDPIEIPEELIKEILPVGDAHLQEERRLFYVGMTRACKYLYLTAAKNYGGKRDKTISGYINETGVEIQAIEKVTPDSKQESLFGVNSGFRSTKSIGANGHIPYSLSYSKINDYKTCPLKYKYKYVLNIPTAPSHALSFGTSIHDTLRDFHQLLRAGQQVSLEKLLDIYERNWQPFGYMEKEHAQLRYESGKKLLHDYYEKNKPTKVKPIEIEKSFTIVIGGIKFFGRIDRIDPMDTDGAGTGAVEIIDYKTGSLKTQKDVDSDDQVALYAIAVREALGFDPGRLTLYFVEEGQKISTTRTPEQLEEKKKEILGVVEDMKKGKFEAKPGMHCKWCDYKEICPHAYKGA
jgi:DNA helicase II / ATP-dependent DNA helicase PcrA